MNARAGSRVRADPPGRWKAARAWIAGGASVALIATIAVVASGYDARETPREEPSVWVTREAGQYARVNTETGELDTVRKISEPSSVVQSGAASVVFSHGNGQAWPIDSASPTDLVDDSGDDGSGGADEGADAADGATAAADLAGGADARAGDADGDADDASVEAGGASAEASSVRMPDGTREVLGAGSFLLVRTESGTVFLGTLRDAAATGAGGYVQEDVATRLTSLQQLDPLADDAEDGAAGGDGASGGDDRFSDAEENAAEGDDAGDAGADGAGGSAANQSLYRADAIALGADGEVAMYSASDGTIARFEAARGDFVSEPEQLPEAATGLTDAQLSLVSGDWVLLDGESGRLWREGAGLVELELDGTPSLQASGDGIGEGTGEDLGGGTAALVADMGGLWRVSTSGEADRIAEAEGTPAQPVTVGGTRYAAWIGQSSGELWRSGEAETVTLEFDESASELGEVEPVFRSNGARAVLSEARTGMLWTLPEGRLIPLSQWSISDPPKEDRGTVVVEEVTEQVAPTAVNDAFGVREGEPAPLPVLLNDYDPNRRDVLTIVPESLGESPLPEEFGTIELMPDAQSLMVHPSAGASGVATFTYRITDGTLTSDAATVTLAVADEATNTAPAWCPVEGCQRAWAVPAIAPGGTLVYPILEGWVDPEGDPMMLASVEVLRPEDPARAIVTSDGRLALRHTDVNAGASEIMLRVTVRDGRGEEQQRELQVSVQPNASAEFMSAAATVQVGSPTTLSLLDRVAGGSGSFVLTDAVVQSGGDRVTATLQQSGGAVEVVATSAGEAILSLGIRDTVTGNEITGVMRVTATPAAPALTLPSLRAFVRPLADSTVEILDAIPGASSRVLSVQAATVVDGELRADVIEHARVRVAGSTADGAPGRIGAVDITVADGGAQTQGRLTVFQVPEAGQSGAIAVADSASVRAGSVVDIRVLDNDAAAPGERLILHPEVTGSGAEGELAFAAGSVLRYLAPETPGTYRLSYTTYGASTPESSDVGAVTVTVLPTGANRDPNPQTLTVRVAPGEVSEVQVPLSGVDPDGDRVRLIGVGQVDDPQIAASITATGASLSVSASGEAAPGLRTAEYSVRDGLGGTGTGVLRIIVTPAPTDGGAPIASTDYARLVVGGSEPVAIRPLDNDIDPARGTLQIVSVEPNVPGGTANPDYQKLTARIDVSRLDDGVILATPGTELGTVSYRYTVQSSASSSTSGGLILVQTSERVGTQAPSVTDTVLNVRDRGDLAGEGVDVVSDKVRWASGDPGALQLSLWEGNRSGYGIDGQRITGSYHPDGDLVVFRLSGVDATGTEVSTYGFLIIPPLDELRVTLKPGLAPVSVDENKTVDVGVRSLVDLGPGDRIELKQGAFGVGRAQAKCETVASDTLRYTAGGEAPWVDTCLIEVRLVGQKSWTTLPVPVTVVPRDPIVQLMPVTRTVAPGGTETIDLSDMVHWQGNRAGDLGKLRFEVSGGGSLFQVQQAGNAVTVNARADAVTGAQEVVSIVVTGAGESRAALTLRVGEAPRDAPRGATVNLQCTVGSSCGIDLVGAAGEYDPFAGKTGGGLKLESVNGASCTFGTIARAGERGVTVSWPDSRGPGGKCTVGFTVRDAQGRAGEGSIEFDAQGVPRAPSSISWTDFGADGVTLTVTLGSQASHPSVSGVEVQGPGRASCSPAGASNFQCQVQGLSPGEASQFTARAVNAVGPSDSSTAVEAWAYVEPSKPTISVTQVETRDNTDPGKGRVKVSVGGSSGVASYEVSVPGRSEPISVAGASGSTPEIDVSSGRLTFSATPITGYRVPTIQTPKPRGESASIEFHVSGAPRITSASLIGIGDNRARVDAAVDANGASSSTTRYGVARSFQSLSCTSDAAEFSDLRRYSVYRAVVCVQTPYGTATQETESTTIGGALPAPGDLTFRVGVDPIPGPGGTVGYEIVDAQPATSLNGATVSYSTGASIVLNPDAAQNITVWQCLDDEPDNCSNPVNMQAETAPTSVVVTPTGQCVVPGDSSSARGAVTISGGANGSVANLVFDSAAGTITITWGGAYASLKPAVLNASACAAPEPPDPPDPVDPTEPTEP